MAVAACLPGAAYTQANSAPAVPSGGRCLEPSLLASRKRSVTSDSLMGKGQFSSRDWLLLFLPGDPCHLVLGLVSRRSRAFSPSPSHDPGCPCRSPGKLWGPAVGRGLLFHCIVCHTMSLSRAKKDLHQNRLMLLPLSHQHFKCPHQGVCVSIYTDMHGNTHCPYAYSSFAA